MMVGSTAAVSVATGSRAATAEGLRPASPALAARLPALRAGLQVPLSPAKAVVAQWPVTPVSVERWEPVAERLDLATPSTVAAMEGRAYAAQSRRLVAVWVLELPLARTPAWQRALEGQGATAWLHRLPHLAASIRTTIQKNSYHFPDAGFFNS